MTLAADVGSYRDICIDVIGVYLNCFQRIFWLGLIFPLADHSQHRLIDF